ISHKNGKLADVLYNASVYKDAGGKVLGVFAAARDISARKKAEVAVRTERKRFEDMLESLPVMICLLSQDYSVIFANKSFREKFGEANGRHCYEYCFRKNEPCDFCESFIVLKTGKPHHWECKCPDGSILDAYDFPFKDIDGSPLILEMDIDITNYRKTQQALLSAQKEVEERKRLSDIGVLAATVAHELRNPLAAINIAAHNIKRKTKDSNLDKHLANISKKVAESDQIINNLLFYSRLKTPHREAIKICDILEECIANMQKLNSKAPAVFKNLRLVKDATIEADQLQIKEVFNNLLSNAYDAIPEKKGKIKITAGSEDGFIKIIVEDNGSGINKDILDKVLDPFFTTKAKGTGLGLSICNQIVALHRGKIDIKSAPGQGASVIVYLPENKKVE
ncbi:MAG: ATP-binding protein, partial [Candidatus Omnitrophica bacterium]|nr:ATP-binding protein [Candidatus Omnitrophota bacterium]